MTSDRHYTSLFRRTMAVLPVLALIGAGWVVQKARSVPSPTLPPMDVVRTGEHSQAVRWSQDLDWTLFRSEQASTPTVRGGLSRRFRLAGTFFAYGSAAGDTRKAVLHDLQESTQMIVGEGETIGDVQVVRIASDRIVLRRGQEEAELWLGFSRSDSASAAAVQAGDAAGKTGDENAFGGKKTGEHSWVFRREALQKYYQDVLDDPERLVRIFDSMKAVRGGDRRISGYRLDILGEGDFYRAAGLRQGDIVRKVNGMNMTSRRRAEFFIGEFARDRANVFEIEIERNGQPQKLTYQIR